MTAHIAIATVIIVAVIALASWLLHKQTLAVIARFENVITAEGRIVRTSLLSTERGLVQQVNAVGQSIVDHVTYTATATRDEVIAGKEHITTEVAKAAEAAGTNAAKAVHEAIGTVRGVKHETCQICGKVANIWKIVDGKIECADCSIRKLVS